MKQHKEGFTLIELLVVITIIGLLATIVVVNVKNVRQKGKDTKRLSDARQIVLALNLYYDKYNYYPVPVSTDGDWERSFEDNGDFLTILETEGYLSQVPLDPINTLSSGYFYSYYRYSAGQYGCSLSNGGYFVLGVREMEILDNIVYVPLDGGGTRTIYGDSPGWHCPEGTGATRDWQEEFDWVTGGFEH